MQERDEDLYWAYAEINELELEKSELKLEILKRDKTILTLGIALGVIVLGVVIIGVLKLCFKVKFPFAKLGR